MIKTINVKRNLHTMIYCDKSLKRVKKYCFLPQNPTFLIFLGPQKYYVFTIFCDIYSMGHDKDNKSQMEPVFKVQKKWENSDFCSKMLKRLGEWVFFYGQYIC